MKVNLLTESNTDKNVSLSQLTIMADQHINQAHPPTKVEVITCYEDVRLSIPEKKFSEELEAAEKLWMEKGYVLSRDSTEEEKRVFGLTADLNQPLPLLTLMMGTGMQELQQQSRQLTANDEKYFSFFLAEMAITVVMKVMQSIPYYANEDLLLYFNQKVTPTLDWVLSSSASADADIVDSSSAGDISKTSISSNSSSRPDLSQYKVQPVVTGDRFVIDDIGYTPLLFSSLTLGSILNIDGKMSSVFDRALGTPPGLLHGRVCARAGLDRQREDVAEGCPGGVRRGRAAPADRRWSARRRVDAGRQNGRPNRAWCCGWPSTRPSTSCCSRPPPWSPSHDAHRRRRHW